ncbi:penicillin-binding protein [Salmonella enterica subsp. enterica serovar Moscow str. SA20061414]|nr:penicillin-binding protein [Salmonella enterica subsp. enterica serovar Moscow str. SA20061414]
MVNVAAGCGWRARRFFIFLALWAADKLWPLPLNEVHPARVVVAHDGTPLWRFADAGGIVALSGDD